MPSSPSVGGGASSLSGAPWRPSWLVRDHGCGMLACPEAGPVLFKEPGVCPRGRFIFGPSRGRSLRSPVGLAFEDAFGVSRPGFHQAPLMGFSKTAPPSTYARDVHSCVRSSRLPVRSSRFGLPLPGAGPVPSSRFLTALTAFSVSCAAGLLHPAADPGVHRVRSSVPASRPEGRASTVRDPSKGFPRQQPPALAGFLPPHRSPSKDGAISGPCSAVESVASTGCCHSGELDPPMGFSLSTSLPSHPQVEAGVPKDLAFLEGPAPLGERPIPKAAEAIPGSCRSSSRSHRPGVWTGSTGLSLRGVYGLVQARGGFEWPVPEVDLSPSLAGRSVAILSRTLILRGFRWNTGPFGGGRLWLRGPPEGSSLRGRAARQGGLGWTRSLVRAGLARRDRS